MSVVKQAEEWRLAALSASHYILKEAIQVGFHSCLEQHPRHTRLKPTVPNHNIHTLDVILEAGAGTDADRQQIQPPGSQTAAG